MSLLRPLCFVFLLTVGALPPAPPVPAGAGIDVVHYGFDLTLHDDTDAITGVATVDVHFVEGSLEAFTLDLVGRRGATGMTVSSVTEGGALVAFTHRNDRLEIRPATPPPSGTRRVYTVAYTGVPADGLIIARNRHGDRTFFGDNWPDRARHWLPVVDHPADKATVDWTVTAPDPYRVVANGERVEETDLPGPHRRTRYRTTAPLPTKIMVIGVARFAVDHVGTVDGTPVETWVYPQDRQAGFYDFAPAVRILRFFEARLGPFPYEKLANVQSKTRYGGMENAGAIFYNEDLVSGQRSFELTVAHEIAHQWFGDSVTEADWPHVWLSEGFATYLAQFYNEATYGQDRFREAMRQAREQVLAFDRNAPTLPLVDTLTTDLTGLLNANSYQKGAWVLHMLRRRVGDAAFLEGLRAYYAQYQDGNARTSDFRRVMEAASGQDLAVFFDQWTRRAEEPHLRGTWHYDAAARQLVVSVRQEQPGAPFRVPLEVGFTDAAGTTGLAVLDVADRVQTFRLPTSAPPETVTPDPHAWLLAELDFSPSDP